VWRTFSLPFVFPSHFSHFRGLEVAFAASRRPRSSESETEHEPKTGPRRQRL
jgi:hypothetical protein